MIVAVVPALDEAPRIGNVVRTLPPAVAVIVVIDDGSSDGTGGVAAASDARVQVVRHTTRQGVGAAIAAGCLRARALGATAIVVLGGDGQMDPADLPAVLRPVLRGEADYVKGDRLAWPDGALTFPLDRLLGVVGLAALTRLATGLSVTDAQCGYCAFSAAGLAAIDLPGLWRGYGYPNALLIALGGAGARIVEVPVRPVYEGAPSNLRLRHVPPIVRMLIVAAARRVLGLSPRVEVHDRATIAPATRPHDAPGPRDLPERAG